MIATKGGIAPYSAHRSTLQPRLVNLIAGLRRHQVEEAVRLLLDYIDDHEREASTFVGVEDQAGRSYWLEQVL
jgi:hypothetical protein